MGRWRGLSGHGALLMMNLLLWSLVMSETSGDNLRLRVSYKEARLSGRVASFRGHGASGLDLSTALLDEYHERLFVGARDRVYSLALDGTHSDYREISWPCTGEQREDCELKGKDVHEECSNFVRVLQPFNQTHLLACGTGAFHPLCALVNVGRKAEDHTFKLEPQSVENGQGRCPFGPKEPFASTVVDGQLYTGLLADFFEEDAAIFRTGTPQHRAIRTEHSNPQVLNEPRFVAAHLIPDTDDPLDNKVYFFFSERATEADGRSRARFSRIGRVCVNDEGGQRVLVNKWSTFTKARLLCSIPGSDGIDTHFDQLEDVFLLQTSDEKNPEVYAIFSTVSDIFKGFAVCAFSMATIRDVFKGAFAHREEPRHHWATFQGRVPYPRPGTCLSDLTAPPGSAYHSTRGLPDEVLHFARSHPLMDQPVRPRHGRPVFVSTQPGRRLTRIAVDRVQAQDAAYDAIFLGTDTGQVLKVISISTSQDFPPEEIILEEIQVFEKPSPILTMDLSVKRGKLYVGTREAAAQVSLQQCELYGATCAECCLARDPYCAWDGHSCTKYRHPGKRGVDNWVQPGRKSRGVPTAGQNSPESRANRRMRRQDIRKGDAAHQCWDQQSRAELSEAVEETVVYGVERNASLLECRPPSLRASITWLVQHAASEQREQVKTDERVLKLEQGLLFRTLHALDSGSYTCRTDELGYQRALLRVELRVLTAERVGRALLAGGRLSAAATAGSAEERSPGRAGAATGEGHDATDDRQRRWDPCDEMDTGGSRDVPKLWYGDLQAMFGRGGPSRQAEEFCQRLWCQRWGHAKHKTHVGKWRPLQDSVHSKSNRIPRSV
ncbi:semaphorin-3G-like [Lampetra fluviatilis]